jgi:hypothetical protein
MPEQADINRKAKTAAKKRRGLNISVNKAPKAADNIRAQI